MGGPPGSRKVQRCVVQVLRRTCPVVLRLDRSDFVREGLEVLRDVPLLYDDPVSYK